MISGEALCHSREVSHLSDWPPTTKQKLSWSRTQKPMVEIECLCLFTAHMKGTEKSRSILILKTSLSSSLSSLWKTLWIFFLTHRSESHCVQCINPALALHFYLPPGWNVHLHELFVPGVPSSSLAMAWPLGRTTEAALMHWWMVVRGLGFLPAFP